MDEALPEPVVCCGREFRLRRALAGHERSHRPCSHADCTYSGCQAALRLHAWEAHGIGPRPVISSTQHAEVHEGRAGASFKVVQEVGAEKASLELQYPGAEIHWHGPSLQHTDAPGEAMACGQTLWPDGVRVLLILGLTGSGKSRLLRSLVDTSPVAPRWPVDQSILDALGSDGLRWLSAVGFGSVPLWAQPHAALSTGEAFRAELARRLQYRRGELSLTVPGLPSIDAVESSLVWPGRQRRTARLW